MNILKSKLQVPALLDDWIERGRLIEEFAESDKVRLIVLQAPAGFGKTTLIRQFLESQKREKTAWLHLESLDSDPHRFTAYIIEALSTIYPLLKKKELIKAVSDKSRPLTDLHDDLLFLLEELDSSAGWLVLDNWEDVDSSKPARELIHRIINLENIDLKLLIASRRPLSLKTGKLRTEGKAILLVENDLAFNLYECESLIHNQTGKAVCSNVLEHLWKATLGWCVSVNLYLQSLKLENDLPSLRPATKGHNNTLNDYIDEEILGKIDSALSDFVIRCSVLDSISLESASVVCMEDCDIKALMLTLSSSSLPHTSLNNGMEIRLHPLFRQAANKILHRKYSHEEVTKIYKKASEFFVSQDRIIDAVESRAMVGDWKETLALIDTCWYELVASNGLVRIDDWFEACSSDIKTDPLYIDIYSRALIQKGENQKAIAYLSDSLDLERFKYERTRLISLKTRYHWARINTEPDSSYEETMRELTSLSDSDTAIDNNVLAGVEVVLCAAAYMDLKIDKGIDHANKALELIGDSLPEYRFSILDNLAILEHTCGNSEKAISLFNAGIDYCKVSGSFSGVPLRSYNMAWIHATTGNYKTALETIMSGRETAERYGHKDVYARMYADRYEGVIRWYLGEHQKGFRLLKRAIALSKEHNPGEHLEIAIALDHCLLMSGKNSSAVNKSLVPAKGTKRETRLGYLGMKAYQSTRSTDIESIYECAREMYDTASDCGLLPWQIHACFLLAFVYDLKGDAKSCQEQIRSGLATMETIKWHSYPMANELLSSFVFIKASRYDILPKTARHLVNSEFRVDLASVLGRELEKNLTTSEYVRLLETAIDLNITGLSSAIKKLSDSKEAVVKELASSYLLALRSNSPRPLNISTMGSFEIVQEGRPVRFSRKTSLRLFQWLLTVYPKPLHKDVIINYLWPDVTSEKGSSSLRTTIRDFRKALDPFNEIHPHAYLNINDDHYSLNLPDNSFVDSIIFLDAIAQAERIALQQNHQEDQLLESTLKTALSLYEGEYLPMRLYEEFAVERRESILSKYLRASLLLSQFLMNNDRTREAVTILKDALKADTLWGDGVYLLIKALSGMGHAVEAMRTFRNYEQKLASELQVEPDDRMVDLFRQLSS